MNYLPNNLHPNVTCAYEKYHSIGVLLLNSGLHSIGVPLLFGFWMHVLLQVWVQVQPYALSLVTFW